MGQCCVAFGLYQVVCYEPLGEPWPAGGICCLCLEGTSSLL